MRKKRTEKGEKRGRRGAGRLGGAERSERQLGWDRWMVEEGGRAWGSGQGGQGLAEVVGEMKIIPSSLSLYQH